MFKGGGVIDDLRNGSAGKYREDSAHRQWTRGWERDIAILPGISRNEYGTGLARKNRATGGSQGGTDGSFSLGQSQWTRLPGAQNNFAGVEKRKVRRVITGKGLRKQAIPGNLVAD